MRVLIISHNVIGETNNMGKTLLSYFQAFSPDEVAEFYIQEREPKNAEVARSYYRVTDRDALKSVFGKRVGTAFHITESTPEPLVGTTGVVESIRQYGRRKSPAVFALRNGIWSLSHWNTKALRAWLREFDPEVIFYLSGNYSFMCGVVLAVQKFLQKPLVVCCVDDFYLYNRNEDSALGRALHRSYQKAVRRVMEKADCILTISDSMSEAYHKEFRKPCHTLHTAAQPRSAAAGGTRNKIAYFGNLGLRRGEGLYEIGRAVRKLGLSEVDGIEVYSPETNPKNMVGLTEENGVRFHGKITAAEVAERTDECMAVIHTESFNEATQKIVKYSVSTKIADALQSGPCLIAYGPEGIASIDYLKANNAACCITRPEDLEPRLRELLTNPALREEIVRNARALAAKNHDAAKNPRQVRAWLQEAIDRAAGKGTSA